MTTRFKKTIIFLLCAVLLTGIVVPDNAYAKSKKKKKKGKIELVVKNADLVNGKKIYVHPCQEVQIITYYNKKRVRATFYCKRYKKSPHYRIRYNSTRKYNEGYAYAIRPGKYTLNITYKGVTKKLKFIVSYDAPLPEESNLYINMFNPIAFTKKDHAYNYLQEKYLFGSTSRPELFRGFPAYDSYPLYLS